MRKVHATKALAMVDGILEQFQEAITFAEASGLEPPPWL